VIKLLEKEFARPLQWFSCMLHANELPLRHLLIHLDGPTTGPKAFSGEIGKALSNVEKREIVSFSPIESKLSSVFQQDLSTDQAYLFEICQSVVLGRCFEKLAQKSPGMLAHSRWVTTANRILRLYVSTTAPSKNLVILTELIVKVYAPMWFMIKNDSSCLMERNMFTKQYNCQDIFPKI
jgi:hypothetical protein